MKNHTCPTCQASGGRWTAKCIGCTARKIIYLRSPDKRTTVKMQKSVLANLHKDTREEVLSMVAELDSK